MIDDTQGRVRSKDLACFAIEPLGSDTCDGLVTDHQRKQDCKKEKARSLECSGLNPHQRRRVEETVQILYEHLVRRNNTAFECFYETISFMND